MKIGVITYYKVMNFGATLQAVSTYCYLKNNGYEPIFINYMKREARSSMEKGLLTGNSQWKAQLNFVNSIIVNQTAICETVDEVMKEIEINKIEAIIVGSDALLQHHPFLSRLRKGRRKPFYVEKISSDRLFPNLFWGVGIADKIPMAIMSVSSQNSAYQYFLPWTKHAMQRSLSNMKYISVRDTWSQDMLREILHRDVPVTPDPVFAFNQNVGDLVPSKEEIISKFNLPENYVLLSLFGQALSKEQISELQDLFAKDNVDLAMLPMPTGGTFDYEVKHDIRFPLSPIDWYALIKYSKGYIGNNMHPIVVSLHNAVPCFSLDNWGRVNFHGEKVNDDSSKILHIMKVFGVKQNHRMVDKGVCSVTPSEIYNGIKSFPCEKVAEQSEKYTVEYHNMMNSILKSFES